MLHSFGYAVSVNSIVFFDVSFNFRPSLFAMQSIVKRCFQSQKISFPSFSSTFPLLQFVVYHFVSSGTSQFTTTHFIANTFKVLLCRLVYSVTTSFLYPYGSWCTVSLCEPHNLHWSHSTNALIVFHALISIICSCNANIEDVFLRLVLHFNPSEFSSQYFTICLFEASP